MILVFSGTGNSLFAAQHLAELLGDSAPTVFPDRPTDVADVERVVWAFPVYSWGVPPVVVDWMRHVMQGCPALSGAEHYAVMTCGDDTGLTARQWQRLIGECGGQARAAFSVQMPNTYVLMKGFDVDAPEVAEAKIAAAPARLADIAGRIRAHATTDDCVRGSFAWVKSAIIYPWFVRHAMSPRPFHASDACVGCGLCARSCPMANITMTEQHRPAWADRCAMCLRCYHICPHRAVQYGRATAGKSRYSNLISLTAAKTEKQ